MPLISRTELTTEPIQRRSLLRRLSVCDYIHFISNSITLWTNLIIYNLTDNYNRFICEIHNILDTHFGDLI
jgi:hypothetical protein